MTFVNLLKRKRDRVGLEPVFDFQWHPLKNKIHIICDFVPSWDVQFGKIQKLSDTTIATSQERLDWNRKSFLEFTQSLNKRALTSVSRLLHC